MPLVCTNCCQKRPKNQFAPDAQTRTGKSSWCKLCKKAYQREYVRRRRLEPEYQAAKAASSKSSRLAWYGLVEADYQQMLELQGGGCAGCGRPPKEDRRLDVDHKHQPGDKKRQPWERASMVRGLLCHLCNRALGILRDNPEVLERLAAYLRNPPAATVVLPKFNNVIAYLEQYEARRASEATVT